MLREYVRGAMHRARYEILGKMTRATTGRFLDENLPKQLARELGSGAVGRETSPSGLRSVNN